MSTITIKEVLEGKSTIIKNKEFLSAKQYIEPFLNKMSKFTDNFTVQVKMPEQMSITKETTDILYNRVLIQAVLPEKYCIDNHDEVIGLVYGLDVRKPVAKLYKGMLNRACTNLCVFDSQWLNIQEIQPLEPLDLRPLTPIMEYTSNFEINLKKLKSTYVDRNDRKNLLGNWVDHSLREYEDYGYGKVKLATSVPIEAYKQLFIDQDSAYYIPEGLDPTLFDIHSSFTEIVTHDKKDLLNSFEKVMIVNKLLNFYGQN